MALDFRHNHGHIDTQRPNKRQKLNDADTGPALDETFSVTNTRAAPALSHTLEAVQIPSASEHISSNESHPRWDTSKDKPAVSQHNQNPTPKSHQAPQPSRAADEPRAANSTKSDFEISATSQRPVEGEVVCFGMVTRIPVTLRNGHKVQSAIGDPVTLESRKGDLFSESDSEKVAQIRDNTVRDLFTTLADVQGIELQFRVTLENVLDSIPVSRPSRKATQSPFLSAIAYGSLDLFHDIGAFFQDHNLYLQDPVYCNRNVQYRNPHRISGSDADNPWTHDMHITEAYCDQNEKSSNLLAGLETDEQLPEASTPAALKNPLYGHQKQALSFMKRRERGWALNSPSTDIWSYDQSLHSGKPYVNNITGDSQSDCPPNFYGGILADDMGLGKTLSTIALIASDPWVEIPKSLPDDSGNGTMTWNASPIFSRATLLVVPPSLLHQWQTQLTQHLHSSGPSRVRWTTHYDSTRLVSHGQLHDHDIVITSFHTLVSEYRKHQTIPSLLFSTLWHRIVLDEAHAIRNRKNATAKAVFDLHAVSRWAVTGTPLQNSLSDFSSLLQFARVYPYHEQKTFEADIVNVWKSEDEDLALERLKQLFKCVAIRRTRASIKLPDRSDLVRYVDFSEAELGAYRRIESPIIDLIDDALRHEKQSPGLYMHALVRINNLRNFCNIGISSSKKYTDLQRSTYPNSWTMREAQAVFEELLSSGQAICSLCNVDVSCGFEEDSMLSVGKTVDAHLTQCMQLLCYTCYNPTSPSVISAPDVCLDHSTCPIERVSMTSPATSPSASPSKYLSKNIISSKVIALQMDLQKSKSEKSVVFSSWTTTLDMVQNMLDEEGILYVRTDGRVRPKERAKNLQRFREDPSIQVMLLTISCGAEGLNLTVASRVYLIEPQWNPTVEEQALARVHRLGQTRTVTTVRLIMRNSIEDHVVNVQNRKKYLADLLLSQQKVAKGAANRERLQHLRDLLN